MNVFKSSLFSVLCIVFIGGTMAYTIYKGERKLKALTAERDTVTAERDQLKERQDSETELIYERLRETEAERHARKKYSFCIVWADYADDRITVSQKFPSWAPNCDYIAIKHPGKEYPPGHWCRMLGGPRWLEDPAACPIDQRIGGAYEPRDGGDPTKKEKRKI